MKEQILKVLNLFQKAYDEKDIEHVDDFLKQLFYSDKDIAILGTSDGEIYFDDNCRKLFINDWKYWGFEKLKVNEAVVKEIDGLYLVHVPASFTYTFKDDDSKRQEHFDDIIEMLSDEKVDQRDLRIKFTEINYELDHIYFPRNNSSRKYRFDLKVCFILNANYKVIQINYSIYENIKRSELRIYPNSLVISGLEYEKKLINTKQESITKNQKILANLKSLFNNYFSNINIFDEQAIVINVDEKYSTNIEEIKNLLNFQSHYWDKISIDENGCYLQEFDQNLIVLAQGSVKKTYSENEYLENTRQEILDLKNKNYSIKQKMFNVRKFITAAFKETAIGNEFEYPVRIHMILTKSNDEYKISYLSYHLYYLLEDRNEFMNIVE